VYQVREIFAFRSAIGIQVSIASYSLAYDGIYLVIGYMSIVPFQTVLGRAVRVYGVRTLKMKCLGYILGSYRDFFYDMVVIDPYQKLVVDYHLHACKLRNEGFWKLTYLLKKSEQL
jgi:hypothetical protein